MTGHACQFFSWGGSCTVAPGWQYNCHPNIQKCLTDDQPRLPAFALPANEMRLARLPRNGAPLALLTQIA